MPKSSPRLIAVFAINMACIWKSLLVGSPATAGYSYRGPPKVEIEKNSRLALENYPGGPD
jgi:hypothetical protein